MKPHLDQALLYWKALLQPHDHVIDATCGNGKDSLLLAGLVPQGHVYSIDIQRVALDKARALIPHSNVSFHEQSHTDLPWTQIKLVVYNLGYLPGGNKNLTTVAATTLQSLEQASQIIVIGGALCVMCYPGHPEGAVEEQAVREWTHRLDPEKWTVMFHQWREKSPNLFFIYKLKN
jgi:SAM-dependent methyltransferase